MIDDINDDFTTENTQSYERKSNFQSFVENTLSDIAKAVKNVNDTQFTRFSIDDIKIRFECNATQHYDGTINLGDYQQGIYHKISFEINPLENGDKPF